jgi:hypothetical protein
MDPPRRARRRDEFDVALNKDGMPVAGDFVQGDKGVDYSTISGRLLG